MTKQISIVNAETGEQIVRDMTADELVEYELGTKAKTEREAAETKAKADKMAILASLGLTEEQAKVLGLLPQNQSTLLGGN